MRILVALLTFVFLYNVVGFSLWSCMAIGLWAAYLIHFFTQLNRTIAFREYILVMYGLNYLFAPALTYEVTQEISFYKMRLNPEQYFSLAIPAMLCLHVGLFAIKTKIFSYTFYTNRLQTLLNEKLLMQWLIAGFFVSLGQGFLPGELGFIAYVVGSIKYVAAFALFVLNRQKYKWYLYGLLFLEVLAALRLGMFHDMVVWTLFFGMVWTYVQKPSAAAKAVLGVLAVVVLFTLQTVKSTYRQALRSGSDGGFASLSAALDKNSEGDGLVNSGSLTMSLTRANQGWIFSSVVFTTDRRQNFQRLEVVKQYFAAAVLPRFLAPNKLQAGDNKIFNEYSGIRVQKGTSMALGLFGDGYIAYGMYGTFLFAFVFGLLCAGTFRIIEGWTTISPYFALFSFPLLNYAVRADCETQTWMGHIVKGLIIFMVIMHFARRFFQHQMQRLEAEDVEPATAPQLATNPA